MKISRTLLVVTSLSSVLNLFGQTLQNDFSDGNQTLQTVGRGYSHVSNGVLSTKGKYALFGQPDWKNYTVKFKARAPKDAEQVQIWAGFRTKNRFDRYVLGIKGGLQDDVYLMRTGYMGADELMGVRPLGFHPEPGKWIDVKIEVCGKRMRVFINDSKYPYIDIEDKNGWQLAQTGEVALGGGWIETEFDDLSITPLAENALDKVPNREMFLGMTAAEKESKRSNQRAAYSPKRLVKLDGVRTDFSLDGDWLFMPTYQLDDVDKATDASVSDEDWHVMNVPDFWSPIRIWLHGETMPSPRGAQPKGVSDTYYQMETDRCENYTFDHRKTKGAWYRQWLELPDDIKGKKLTLQFDAVSKVAEIYINGHKAASHIGMFGNFDVDATPYLHPGKNLIAINVVRDIKGAGPQTSDAMENFYSSVRKDVEDNKDDAQANAEVIADIPHGFFGDNPAGIWQPVKLMVTDPLLVEDVYIKPSMNGAEFEITVDNTVKKKRRFDIKVDITDKSTGETLYSGILLKKIDLAGNSRETYKASVLGIAPKLWEPETPNLYDFKFSIIEGKNLTDEYAVTSGFRTFEAKNGFFYLNGRKFWLRGGNHIPFSLGMDNEALADTFMSFMREGNVNSTRTHTTPWNELWMSAADRNGIAVSFEGTWSWLMIHSTPIPSQATLDLWSREWFQVMKKFRNHPSIIFWTINNEMKFYDLDADTERAKQKFCIISDVVKDMRKVDPTRPISFDSNYMHRNGVNRFGEEFMATVDDGDIDDNHAYYNWYDFSVFRFFNGEFQNQFLTPGRPLISQEMSTGYPNAETGHPTRSYQLIHQNPYSLIGYEAYDFADPKNFLKVQSFITGELAEALRRSNDKASGIMHFAYMTWFRQCYDENKMAPWPTYYAMQRAMQPVLVSAELWGRNFYAGQKIPTRIYVVNDSNDGRDLGDMELTWTLIDDNAGVLATGHESFPAVPYYGRQYIEPVITLPETMPEGKTYGKLVLSLKENGKEISANEYDLTFAPKSWATVDAAGNKILFVGDDKTASSLRTVGLNYDRISSITEMLDKKQKADLCIIGGIENISEDDAKLIRDYQKQGGNLLMLDAKNYAGSVYPEYISDVIIPTEGDIVVMERSDDPVFDMLDPLDLRYFNNNKREIPLACNATLKAVRDENVKELASQMKIHAYIDGGKPEDRIKKIESMRGLTMMEVSDGNGKALISTMTTDKAETDPIAGRVLVNMIKQSLR
ncbi:MAG: glycoside hydrolase family 2 [Bacteroides sp.]|nr:glycoside hydrolase family 2 [Bacteroides sp.]